MNTTLLFKVLQLDSIINALTWHERVRIHLYINDKAKMTTPTILHLYEWIEKNKWVPPELKYGQDRLLYYWSKNDWQPIEDLAKILKQKI